jgi:hypothetical protein
MCKKMISIVSFLVLCFSCSSFAEDVIGNWEDGSYDGWIDWGEGQVTIESIDGPKYTFSDIGVTLGSSSLKVSPGSGWQQNLSVSLADVNALDAFMKSTAFAIDVTYNSADWDPATTYAQVYQVSFNNNGYGWNDVGGAAAPTGMNGVAFIDTLNPDSPGALPIIDPGTEGVTMTGTWMWDYSGVLDRFTLPEEDAYIQIVFATNSDQPGAYYFDNARLISAEPQGPKPNIIWVSFSAADNTPSTGAADAGFTEAPDIGYTNLLKDNGYNVTRYLTTATPDANVLNAADLVIISRSIRSDDYANDAATTWNDISAPMIIMSGYTLRSSRMGYTVGTNMPDTTGDIKLTVSDPNHPIFAGIPLTDDTMDNPYAGIATYPTDANILALGISINDDPVNVFGTVLAVVSEASADNGPVGGMVIGEWQAGAELTHDGGAGTDVLGGHRLVFLSGSREADGISSETAGIFDLQPDGSQMFLNAVKYMLPVKPTHSWTFEDGTPDDSVGTANGTLFGNAVIRNGLLVVDGDGDWMEMPGDVIDINSYSALTLELWSAQEVDNPYSMTASFGSTWENGYGKDYIFIATGRGDQMNRGAIANTPNDVNPWENEVGVSSPELVDGLDHQYVLTIDAEVLAYYVDGVLIGTADMNDTTIAGTSNDYVYLGKGVYSVDATMNCSIDEFDIYDHVLSAGQVQARYAAGPVKLGPELVDPGTEGLLAYYPLDAAYRGSVPDASGNGNDGTIIGDPQFVPGVVDQAIELNGDGEYVDCGDDPLFGMQETNNMTAACWVTISSIANQWAAIVAKGENAWRLGNVDFDPRFHFGISIWNAPDTPSVDGVTAVGFDEWHHVAGVFDGADIKLYLDGAIDASSPTTIPIGTNDLDVFIGDNPEATGRYWDGIIDEVRIYNKALSESEVLFLAQ